MTASVSRLGFLVLGLTLFTAGQGTAQAPPAPSAEGVAVHGRWTVTVTRDGKVVERREFQNALTAGGQFHLSRALSRQRTPGPWIILVEADGTGSLCAGNEFINGTDADCAISESAAEATATVTNDTVVLEGTETVVRAGNIEVVSTFQWWCGPDTAPATCQGSGTPSQVTLKVLDSVIPVQVGDRIEVQVVISFS
jgi:hypothetical protein